LVSYPEFKNIAKGVLSFLSNLYVKHDDFAFKMVTVLLQNTILDNDLYENYAIFQSDLKMLKSFTIANNK
jgi:hypothetical protein